MVGVNYASLTGHPDLAVGVEGYSEVTADDYLSPGTYYFAVAASSGSHTYRFGWNGGVEFAYQLGSRWAIAAELQYSLQGTRYENKDLTFMVSYARQSDSWSMSSNGSDYGSRGIGRSEGDDTYSLRNFYQTMHYLNVPLLMRCYLTPSLAVEFGVQPAYCFQCKAKCDLTFEGDTQSIDTKVDDISAFDLSVPVGICYEYDRFVIDARYNCGTKSICKGGWDGGSNPFSRNSVFQLSVGYRFAL